MDRRGLPRNETQVNLQGLGLDTSAIPSPLMYGGFVDVTQPEPPRISTLRRIKSTSTFMETQEDSVKFTYRQVENKINSLQRELLELRNRLDAFEEDHRKPKWAVKYSRRVALFSNLGLALFIFWTRFLKRLQSRKTKLLQNMVVPQLKSVDTFNIILYDAFFYAFAKSWAFFLAIIFLISAQGWKRTIGLIIANVTSFYFAWKAKFMPWTNYGNMCLNSLNFIAQWASSSNPGTKTLRDYIRPLERTSPRSESSDEEESTTPPLHPRLLLKPNIEKGELS